MWNFKHKPLKKVVEARARYGGVDMLLTVSSQWTKLSMNGGAHIKPYDFDDFADELKRAAFTAREILDAQ